MLYFVYFFGPYKLKTGILHFKVSINLSFVHNSRTLCHSSGATELKIWLSPCHERFGIPSNRTSSLPAFQVRILHRSAMLTRQDSEGSPKEATTDDELRLLVCPPVRDARIPFLMQGNGLRDSLPTKLSPHVLIASHRPLPRAVSTQLCLDQTPIAPHQNPLHDPAIRSFGLCSGMKITHLPPCSLLVVEPDEIMICSRCSFSRHYEDYCCSLPP
jgi:hypothetical protein